MGAPAGFEDVVAALNPIPDDQPDVPPHWSVTFAVDDADATAAKAAELGGQVVVPPFDAPWVRMTVITDPQGATFTASKFVLENGRSQQSAGAANAALSPGCDAASSLQLPGTVVAATRAVGAAPLLPLGLRELPHSRSSPPGRALHAGARRPVGRVRLPNRIATIAFPGQGVMPTLCGYLGGWTNPRAASAELNVMASADRSS